MWQGGRGGRGYKRERKCVKRRKKVKEGGKEVCEDKEKRKRVGEKEHRRG